MRGSIIALSALLTFLSSTSATAEKACFEIQGMTCATCSITVNVAVKKLNGIRRVKASLSDRSAVVDFDAEKTNAVEIKKAIEDVGYKANARDCKINKG